MSSDTIGFKRGEMVHQTTTNKLDPSCLTVSHPKPTHQTTTTTVYLLTSPTERYINRFCLSAQAKPHAVQRKSKGENGTEENKTKNEKRKGETAHRKASKRRERTRQSRQTNKTEKTRDQTNKDRRKPPRIKVYISIRPSPSSQHSHKPSPSLPLSLTNSPPSHPPLAQANNAHLQRPHPANPDLELGPSGQALDVLELDALPPAAAGRLAPEQQQLLRHADRVVADLVAADVGAQPRQRQRADDRLVGLARAVAPVVVVVEAAGTDVGVSFCVAERGGGNEGVGRKWDGLTPPSTSQSNAPRWCPAHHSS